MRLVASAALLLAGCATWYPANNGPASLPCKDRPDCDRLWSAVQVAIAESSRYRIQIANDTIIETFGPTSGTGAMAYRASRQMNGDGGGTIRVRAVCYATVYGCINDPAAATASVAARALASGGGPGSPPR